MKTKCLFFLLILACASKNEEQLKTIYIADHLVDCTGVSAQKCMLVREGPEEEWANFYDDIDGFDYEEGYEYQISVEVQQVDNPPADASSLRYVLREIISKVPTDTAVQIDPDLLGSWKVIRMDGMDDISINPTFEFMEEENRVAGFAGCNNYFATYSISGQELKIGAAGSTRKMCQDMSVEDVFLEHLQEVARYKIEKSELHLFDSNDKLLYLAVSE